MTARLSDRVLSMQEAATLRMARRVRACRAQGLDIDNLTLGEPDFDTPQFIKTAARDAMNAGLTKYTPVAGLTVLREAICRKLKRDNGLDYDIDNIVVSNGAKQSLINSIMALVNPGDEVILPSPYWVSYMGMVRAAGGVPVIIETGVGQAFKISAQQLQEAISDKTRLLVLNSPGNPSGSVYSKNELEALAGVIRAHDQLMVLSDEIYEHIVFEGEHVSFAALDGMAERTITVNGMSKGFAMTGWRIGYLAAPEWLARATTKIQGQFTSGANSIAQAASVAALDMGQSCADRMQDSYKTRRDLALGLLKQIPGLEVSQPRGAFYIFPNAGHYMQSAAVSDSEQLCDHLLLNGLVATVPGAAFGSDDCFRISFAASEETLERGIGRIADSLAEL